LQWKRVIHSASQCYAPDSALRAKIHRDISPKPAWWHLRPVFAAAAAVLLIVAGGRIIQLTSARPHTLLVEDASQQSRNVGELADLHVTTLASANPVDVVSSDRHNVKPWFAGKIPFTFDLPELQGSPFELVGGRVSYLEQAPGAQLLFRVRKHQISVFIFQARDLSRDFAVTDERDARSFHLQSWRKGGLQYFAISDVAPEDLRELGDLLRK
jgi:anti-sigma factor RsiW